MTTIRFSYRNATIVVCSLNVAAVVYLLLNASSSSSLPVSPSDHSAMRRYMKECEDIRLSMQPLDLIKRVREIQHEVYTEPKMAQPKQTLAFDLSKRLKDFRSGNDASSLKGTPLKMVPTEECNVVMIALEEWRKRKMERVRQRGLEMNGTASS